ncbi:MAG: class I tRNA ligase family protein, partial [Patescibacteria group bacterium]
ISRFVLQKTDAKITNNNANDAKYQPEDKEILKKLEKIKKEVEEGINQYQFGHALHALYDFIWHEFADKYIETSKKREDDAVKNVLARLLADSLKLLHPFMPFITEEIYGQIKKEELLIISQW